MDTTKVGAALSRDISAGERVEGELDAFIESRDKKRVKSEGERAQEAAWRESVRRHDAARDARLRQEWCEYHLNAAQRHRANLEALAAHHEEQAQRYLPNAKGA